MGESGLFKSQRKIYSSVILTLLLRASYGDFIDGILIFVYGFSKPVFHT